jgi:hypothetical protein
MATDRERERKGASRRDMNREGSFPSNEQSSRGPEASLENAQRDQDQPGRAGSNPSTTGPAENLRDKAAKAEDKSEDSEEPV